MIAYFAVSRNRVNLISRQVVFAWIALITVINQCFYLIITIEIFNSYLKLIA